jgi:hypothetical protein
VATLNLQNLKLGLTVYSLPVILIELGLLLQRQSGKVLVKLVLWKTSNGGLAFGNINRPKPQACASESPKFLNHRMMKAFELC